MLAGKYLAPYVRFVEIGKRDMQDNARLGVRQFMQNVTFTAVDLGAIRADRPQVMARVLKKVMDLVSDNKLRPITPRTTFSNAQVEQAFRLMQSGKHTGKIVIQAEKSDQVMVCQTCFVWRICDRIQLDSSFVA